MSNNKIDIFSGYMVDRYEYIKGRLARTAPRYIAHETPAHDIAQSTIPALSNHSEERIQKLTVMVSWVYSNIISLGSKCSALKINVLTPSDKDKMSKDKDHPLAKVFECPNEFMSFSYLIRHLIFGLSISTNGAFWYLAPDPVTGELSEIWPIDSNNIEPVKNANHYVTEFLYTAKEPMSKKVRQFKIHKDFIFWIKYPNPWDYWESLPPLIAALFPATLSRTINENQQRIYGDSRGIPLSLVSLDPDLSEKDFMVAKEQIIHDWQQREASIAITRGGQLSIQSLGFTYEQLETVDTQNITRDQIDVAFFGYPYRSEKLTSGEGLKQMDRIIQEQVIFPLLNRLIQETITAQIVKRFYPDEKIRVEFDDPRTADRALNIQESMIASRWNTVNEMREAMGDPPMEDFMGVAIGELPVSLANNSAFIMSLAGLSGAMPQHQQAEGEVGNLTDSAAPEAQVGELLGGESPAPLLDSGVNNKSVMTLAVMEELGRWKKVSRRNVNRGENRDFTTDIIPIPIQDVLNTSLEHIDTVERVNAVFAIAGEMAEEWISEVA